MWGEFAALKARRNQWIRPGQGPPLLLLPLTMCTIMLTFFPGYFPSVLRGERSNRLAPLRLDTACQGAGHKGRRGEERVRKEGR